MRMVRSAKVSRRNHNAPAHPNRTMRSAVRNASTNEIEVHPNAQCAALIQELKVHRSLAYPDA